jgi:hypothetical protein
LLLVLLLEDRPHKIRAQYVSSAFPNAQHLGISQQVWQCSSLNKTHTAEALKALTDNFEDLFASEKLQQRSHNSQNVSFIFIDFLSVLFRKKLTDFEEKNQVSSVNDIKI